MCNNDVLTYIFIIMFFYVLLTRLQIVDLLSGTAGSVPDKVRYRPNSLNTKQCANMQLLQYP